MKKVFILLSLLVATQARAQLTVPSGGTGRTWTIPYGVIIGGTISSDALQQVMPGDSLTFLQSLGPGLSPRWTTIGVVGGTQSVSEADTIHASSSTVYVTNTSDGYSLTMPPSAQLSAGKQITVKDVTSGGAENPVTLMPDGEDALDLVFDNGASLSIESNNAYTFQLDDSGTWWCIARTNFNTQQ